MLYKDFEETEAQVNDSGTIWELQQLCLFPVSFDELAKQSDFLAVCCALTPETKEICNKNLFSKMKSSSIFINTSR